MRRKCSQCGNTGHNLRTCPFKNTPETSSFRLFGVHLNPTSSAAASASSPSSYSSCNSSTSLGLMAGGNADNNVYAYDELFAHTQERKKGVAWTKEEHRQFLVGLENLGKGDWKGISRDFVPSRTPSQIASHAQKFYLRQFSLSGRKRRPSLFDMEISQPSVQNPSEQNNYCGLTLESTKQASLADDFRSIKLEHFASNEPNLELQLASNSASFPQSESFIL